MAMTARTPGTATPARCPSHPLLHRSAAPRDHQVAQPVVAHGLLHHGPHGPHVLGVGHAPHLQLLGEVAHPHRRHARELELQQRVGAGAAVLVVAVDGDPAVRVALERRAAGGLEGDRAVEGDADVLHRVDGGEGGPARAHQHHGLGVGDGLQVQEPLEVAARAVLEQRQPVVGAVEHRAELRQREVGAGLHGDAVDLALDLEEPGSRGGSP